MVPQEENNFSNRYTAAHIMQSFKALATKIMWHLKTAACNFVLLTFGMIPHITQERRAENNIHHTGRIEGTVVDAEKM